MNVHTRHTVHTVIQGTIQNMESEINFVYKFIYFSNRYMY